MFIFSIGSLMMMIFRRSIDARSNDTWLELNDDDVVDGDDWWLLLLLL